MPFRGREPRLLKSILFIFEVVNAITDQLGNSIKLASVPRRIVSVVPSQSQFLWDIGLRTEIVGISKFCIHPNEMFRTVERVGGTKELNLDRIRALKPDLIIGNKEENTREQIETLRNEFPVWMSDIFSFDDAFGMMEQLGKITDREEATKKLLTVIRKSLDDCRNLFSGQRVAYFIWNRPYMFAGKHTFIDHVLTHLGFQNAVGSLERYPVLEIEDLHNAQPELCFLSSEPFPFKEIHAEMLRAILPESKVLLVDGEVFSWYGSSLLRLNDYARSLAKHIQ